MVLLDRCAQSWDTLDRQLHSLSGLCKVMVRRYGRRNPRVQQCIAAARELKKELEQRR